MIGEWKWVSSELADWLTRFNIQSYNDETIIVLLCYFDGDLSVY